MSKAQSSEEEGLWIDPPSGWNYGFPKLMSKEDALDKNLNFHTWLIKNGYPESLIKEFGEHFYVRQWSDSWRGEFTER